MAERHAAHTPRKRWRFGSACAVGAPALRERHHNFSSLETLVTLGEEMKNIANLLFEARMLKEIPRSGYAFLGAGDESVAEHTFMITFIAFVMAQTMPEVDGIRLVNMCLVHDLPEARIGDLNPVQKQYVKADESLALSDTTRNLPFGKYLTELMEDFNTGKSMEARLAG